MQWLRANAARREFESFVTDSTGPLLRTAFLMARDLAEAEDLVQETFLRVARHWPRVCAMNHPAAYARRVLVNLVIDGAERRSRRTGELDGRLRALDWSDGRAERDLAAVDVHAGAAGGAGRAADQATSRHRAALLGGPAGS